MIIFCIRLYYGLSIERIRFSSPLYFLFWNCKYVFFKFCQVKCTTARVDHVWLKKIYWPPLFSNSMFQLVFLWLLFFNDDDKAQVGNRVDISKFVLIDSFLDPSPVFLWWLFLDDPFCCAIPLPPITNDVSVCLCPFELSFQVHIAWPML